MVLLGLLTNDRKNDRKFHLENARERVRLPPPPPFPGLSEGLIPKDQWPLQSKSSGAAWSLASPQPPEQVVDELERLANTDVACLAGFEFVEIGDPPGPDVLG